MTGNAIFGLKETLMATGALAKLQNGVRGTVLRMVIVALCLFCLVVIGVIDWEVYFRIFQYMTDGEDFWSPHLMACTPAIMLTAFHVIANRSPHHPIVALVRTLSVFFIVAFMVGGGFYIAAMLYSDAGVPGQATLELPALGALPSLGEPGANQSWIDALFANVTSPTGVLALSLGIGGLSVVSVYAGHELLCAIERNVREITLARSKLRDGLAHHRASKDAEARFAVLADEHDRLLLQSDEQLLAQIAGLVLRTINTHLMPHERRLQQMRFASAGTVIDQDYSAEIKRVEAALKQIRAITLKDILNAIALGTTRSTK